MRLQLGTTPAPIEVRSAGVNSAPTSHTKAITCSRALFLSETPFFAAAAKLQHLSKLTVANLGRPRRAPPLWFATFRVDPPDRGQSPAGHQGKRAVCSTALSHKDGPAPRLQGKFGKTGAHPARRGWVYWALPGIHGNSFGVGAMSCRQTKSPDRGDGAQVGSQTSVLLGQEFTSRTCP
jgi:hypothetical protein